jgi:hypothetical protein
MPVAMGTTGEQKNGPGVTVNDGYRQGYQGDVIVSELNGRYYEQTLSGRGFQSGMTLTSISNATFTTLTNSTTPIVGVWNPPTSKFNLQITQAILGVAITAATSTGGAPFVWASSVGNLNLTAAGLLVPWNTRDLIQGGSFAKGLAGIALTGLTNNLVIMGASALSGGSVGAYSQIDTAVGFSPAQGGNPVENFDGSLIVPPGGVLALLATTTPVAHSAASMLKWIETPIPGL